MGADDLKVDVENRTVEFPFSSELPVERYFGQEILSHEKQSIDLSRAHLGAMPLLYNHDMNELRGKVEQVRLGTDRRLYATARFANTADGNEAMQLVKDGMLPNVSFGYVIEEMKMTKAGGNGTLDQYTATKWSPYEISLVTVPADPTVGFGRSDEGQEYEVTVISPELLTKGKKEHMEENNTPKIDIVKERAEATAAEKTRIASITATGVRFEQPELARQLIDSGKSLNEANAAFLEKLQVKQVPLKGNEGDVGMSEEQTKEYSFVKILHALANPTDRRAQEAASFERECSEAAAAKAGKAARGFMVPVDVLRAKRDLTVGSSTAGGNTVSTDLMAQSFIELLRKKSIVQAAGATVMNGLVGNVAIPRATGASTAYWVAESGAPTESAPAFDQVSLSPKTVGAFVDISRRLLIQSSIDVEAFVRGDIAKVLALEIDRAALYGLGSSNQPLGLKAQLAAYNSASQELNLAGATPTFAEIVSLETKITSVDAEAANMKYLFNASMAGALKTAVKVSGYPVYILENGELNGYAGLVSNQSASGDVWFGDWSSLFLGFWSGLDLTVDPYQGATSGTVRVIGLQDCDIAVRHAESFSRGNDTP